MTQQNSHFSNILKQYRIAALSTPLSAYEMTELDKEMGNILTRTDLPTNKKLKQYYIALNKFQQARNIYEKSKKPEQLGVKQQQQIPSGDNNQNEEEVIENEEYDEFFTPGRGDVYEDATDEGSTARTPSSSKSLRNTINFNRRVLDDRKDEIMKDVLDSLVLKENKSNKSKYLAKHSPSRGGELIRVGGINEVEPIIDYLLGDGTINTPKKISRRNKKLTEIVADILLQPKYFDVTDNHMSDVYPTLDQYSYARIKTAQPFKATKNSPLNKQN